MQRIGDLLKELGFNKDAPLETQKAFVKHLIQAAERPTQPIPQEKVETVTEKLPPTQLSFDSDILGFSNHDPMYRKARSQR